MRKYIITLFISILSIQIGLTQTLDTSKLNDYFKSLDSNNKFMGSVALFNNGELVYNNQIGYADIETKQKPNQYTKYRIGSISKTFTATLVLKAIEEEKISLDKTLKNYFPNIPNSNLITISNLLYHRSGIHNYTNDKAYLKYNTKQKSKKEMLSIISKFDSDFKPNSKFEYSNSNYLLLSYILEKTYNKTYSEILNEKIINPIGLKNTFFGSKINLDKNESFSYSYKGKWEKQTETNMSILLGAGGIVSTPNDLLQFSAALFNYKIISKNSLSKMVTLEDNYGMGLFKIPFYDKFSFGHTGGVDGFSSVFSYFPKEKCAFALTSNGTIYDNNKISIVLLSALFNKSFDIPTFESYVLTTEDLDTYLGIYSSPSFPLKITVTKSENILIAQATGQSAFSLDSTEKDIFNFEQAGIVLEFDPKNNQMTLKQGGGSFKLTKE